MKFEVTNKSSGTYFPIGTASDHDGARGLIGESLVKAIGTGGGHLDDEAHAKFIDQTREIVDMKPGDYIEVPFRNFTYAVRMLETPTFDRDAYGEALDAINNAIDAVRRATYGVSVLRDAGEEFDIEPFKTIADNYKIVTQDAVFNQLEHGAADASVYYPKAG